MQFNVRRPQSLRDWLILIPGMLIGLVVMLVSLALLLLVLLVSPILVWWHRRKAPRGGGGPLVIDADYTVHSVSSEPPEE